jgi:hypothetical protein
LAKWLYYKENSPSKKLRMTTTPTPSPEDTMTVGHTPKNKSSNPDVLVAVEKQVTAAQQAAQGLTYTPFLFMPKKYRIAGVELAKITTAPPTVPKFPDVDVPMPVVGLVMDQPHSYSEGLDVFWQITYTPAYLKYKTTSPFFELCDSTGKTKSADDCHLLPPFNEKFERLRMARNAFQDQLSQIGKAHTEYGGLMAKFRVAHRAWEVSILEEYQIKKSIMTDIRRWKREEDRKDDDGEYDTFFFGDLKMPDDRLVYQVKGTRPEDHRCQLGFPSKCQTFAQPFKKSTKQFKTSSNQSRRHIQQLQPRVRSVSFSSFPMTMRKIPKTLTCQVTWPSTEIG